MSDVTNGQRSETAERHRLPEVVREVETAIPVFIGYTQKCEKNGRSLLTKRVQSIMVSDPVEIFTIKDYENYFGKSASQHIEVAISDTLDKNSEKFTGSNITVKCIVPPIEKMYYHLQMFFANGGGKCYVVSVGDTAEKTVSVANLLAGLESARNGDEITLLVFPQTEQLQYEDAATLYQAALKQAAELHDRFAILDCFNNEDSFSVRDVTGLRNLDFGAVYHPYLQTTFPVLSDQSDTSIDFVVNNVADQSIKSLDDLPDGLKHEVLSELRKLTIVLPPSSAIAGIYVRNDAAKKVWSAPADVILSEVMKPTIQIDGKGQAVHIADAMTGKSINVIRDIPNKGAVVIGARTLAGSDKDWKYISMRRLFIMIISSIKKSVGMFANEPNDSRTWVKVQLLIENFLMSLWYKGVLQGADPDRAYYVKVGIGETMTEEDIRQCRMIIEIGLAPVIPSEFIVIKIVQSMS